MSYNSRLYSKSYNQFFCLAGRESLRDIETCLNSHQEKLYHIGFRGAVSRTTLADANGTQGLASAGVIGRSLKLFGPSDFSGSGR